MRPSGGWNSISDVEITTAEYVGWFNHRRLQLGEVPPAEFVAKHWPPCELEPYPDHVTPAGAGAR